MENEEKSPFKIPPTIPLEIREAQSRLIEQLKVVVSRKINQETQMVVSKELIQAPPKKYPKPNPPVVKRKQAEKLPTACLDLDDLLKEIDASASKKTVVHDPIIATVNELELLATDASLIAENFGTGQEIDQKAFLGLLKDLNGKSDSLANLVPTYMPFFAPPPSALQRLDSFVKTLHETNSCLAQNNTELKRLTLFNRYTTSIASLSAILTQFKQS